MAKLQLRGEYVKNILANFDKMESDTRKPVNALQAAQASIIPAEFIMAYLCGAVMWLSKRHSMYFVEQLFAEIVRDLKTNQKQLDSDAEQRINKMLSGLKKNGN